MGFDENSPVWLTGFWGFDPEDDGILGFSDERDRERFLAQSPEARRLVCVYGAASPETASHLVHHLLGVIEVECIPIDSWSKMSDESIKRNISLGWDRKWRYAMPVRRAWRTKHTLSVGSVFPRSYKASAGRYVARFGRWLEQEEALWLLTKVPFREVPVFGEPSLPEAALTGEGKSLESLLKPSQGIFGAFGERSYEVVDRPHHLYLAHFPVAVEQLLGVSIGRDMALLKIGISGDLKKRLSALNLSFPEKSLIGWKIIRHAKFGNRDSAGAAETQFKVLALEQPKAQSLGREFFLMNFREAENLFIRLSPATGLEIRQKT